MIPAQFEYVTPKTLEDALHLIERHGDEAKILAGGHSLLPLMKLRLAQPRYVIDIGRLRNMNYIREENGRIAIGALTTHSEIESSTLLRAKCPLLAETPPSSATFRFAIAARSAGAWHMRTPPRITLLRSSH